MYDLPIQHVFSYKFAGKERDSQSGRDNFGARYYASNTGSFMSPDWALRPVAVPYAKFGDPQTLNLYTYVENSPLDRVDADGHCTDMPGRCQADENIQPGTANESGPTQYVPGYPAGQARISTFETRPWGKDWILN